MIARGARGPRPASTAGSGPASLLLGCLALLGAAACGNGGASELPDTAETVIGERLFRETCFSQFHAAQVAALRRTVNDPFRPGDDVVSTTETLGDPLPGPYAGRAMNCAACHLVDEQRGEPAGGTRTYGDFARRSPVPARADGRTVTPRNSPPLVASALPRDGAELFHFDAEFASLEDLVAATFTGRNFGWLPGERALAIAHVARVIREDDGSDANAADHDGRPYAVTLRAPANLLPPELLLRPAFRLDVETATDAEVFDAVVRIVAQYVRELRFAEDPGTGRNVGSAYDRFLALNGLPAAPDPLEPPLAYARRLRTALGTLASPRFLGARDGRLALHPHPFGFGPLELRGLGVFLAEPVSLPLAPGEVHAGGVGSCVRCHVPPAFTDFRLHNVGFAQEEYDAVHGDGAFASLPVPGLAARNAAFETFLPATEVHPLGEGPFLDVPRAGDPMRTDLGLWNVFGNPDVPGPQAALRTLLLGQLGLPPATTDAELLPRTLAWFKTPSLRDLGQSAPYAHTGRFDAIEDVLRHYRRTSGLARAGLVRNSAPELEGIALTDDDAEALAAFLRALDEDYE